MIAAILARRMSKRARNRRGKETKLYLGPRRTVRKAKKVTQELSSALELMWTK